MAMTTKTNGCVAVLLGFATLGTGCSSFKLKDTPTGFAEVDRDERGYAELRAKAGDDVGLRIVTFGNVRGGSLPYWSKDLVEKLGNRSYVLQGHAPARSANGVAGTRFDFTYDPPGEAGPKFYSVVLFTSDAYRVVIQMAGDQAKAQAHRAELDEVARTIRVRGCRTGSSICKGPQPSGLDSAPPSAPAAAPAAGG